MSHRPTEAELRATDAASWGGKPAAKLRVISFKKMRRNTLRGFATVQLGSGLRLFDCPVHLHANGRAWVALPGRPVLSESGSHKRDPNGKLQYVRVAEWPDRTTSDRFSKIVIALLLEMHPNALDGWAGVQ
jgi:hypothetical protein